MKRYKSLLRDTWPVWLIFMGGGCIGGIFLPVALMAIPISLFSFIYFGLMRYDADGVLRSQDQG